MRFHAVELLEVDKPTRGTEPVYTLTSVLDWLKTLRDEERRKDGGQIFGEWGRPEESDKEPLRIARLDQSNIALEVLNPRLISRGRSAVLVGDIVPAGPMAHKLGELKTLDGLMSLRGQVRVLAKKQYSLLHVVAFDVKTEELEESQV